MTKASFFNFSFSRTQIIVGIILLVLSLAATLSLKLIDTEAAKETYTLTNPSQTVHAVTYTKDGFVPNELVIRLGEKVVFNTDTDSPYWPASSLHPTHEIYPEFDPKDRIVPPENWEFVFDRVGSWKYHDHINAHATGVITVIDPADTTKEQVLSSCVDLEEGYQKQQCWDNELSRVLQEDGVKAAFAYFVELYKTEPDVPKACHEWGHSLGEASYEEYKKTGDLVLVPEASYCGYGYFHSFIAELVKDTGDFEPVIQFCADVVEELKEELSGVQQNCVHGVGHGTTAWLLENPENWGNFQKTADEGTAICERLYTTEEDLANCYDGVYNELHLDLMNEEYGLDFDAFLAKNDPFWICDEQKDAHKEPCYFEFVGIFWRIFDMDFAKAITYVVENVDGLEERGPRVVGKIAADWIQFDIVNDSHERNIEGCRLVPKFLLDSCINGLANGFIQHGEPNNMHVKAFTFCNADYLLEEEKEMCFRHFLGMLPYHYDAQHVTEVCNLVPERFQITCKKEG
jgi:hypothetical protein